MTATSTNVRHRDALAVGYVGADGDVSAIEVRWRGDRLRLRRTPVGAPAESYVQRARMSRPADLSPLDGLASSSLDGPVTFAVRNDDTERSAELAHVDGRIARLRLDGIADLTVVLVDEDDDPATPTAMTGFELYVVLMIVLIVAGVGTVIVVTDSDKETPVEGQAGHQEPPPDS